MCQGPPNLAHPPSGPHPEVRDNNVHIWFTTPAGIIHSVIIPRASVSPELVVEALSVLLGTDVP
jgi:hypothetical protein